MSLNEPPPKPYPETTTDFDTSIVSQYKLNKVHDYSGEYLISKYKSHEGSFFHTFFYIYQTKEYVYEKGILKIDWNSCTHICNPRGEIVYVKKKNILIGTYGSYDQILTSHLKSKTLEIFYYSDMLLSNQIPETDIVSSENKMTKKSLSDYYYYNLSRFKNIYVEKLIICGKYVIYGDDKLRRSYDQNGDLIYNDKSTPINDEYNEYHGYFDDEFQKMLQGYFNHIQSLKKYITLLNHIKWNDRHIDDHNSPYRNIHDIRSYMKGILLLDPDFDWNSKNIFFCNVFLTKSIHEFKRVTITNKKNNIISNFYIYQRFKQLPIVFDSSGNRIVYIINDLYRINVLGTFISNQISAIVKEHIKFMNAFNLVNLMNCATMYSIQFTNKFQLNEKIDILDQILTTSIGGAPRKTKKFATMPNSHVYRLYYLNKKWWVKVKDARVKGHARFVHVVKV